MHGRRRRTKEKNQYCSDSSGTIVYFRALQGHSGRNLIDPSLQDNVIIQSNFFQYIFHVGCALNLHFIISSVLILGGQNLSNRQTVFFLLVHPMDKEHKDPDESRLGSTASCTIHAYSMEETSNTRRIGSTSTLLWRNYWRSIRHDRTLPLFTKHSQLIVSRKLLSWWDTGEVKNGKVYASPRPPRKISLKHDWMKELGSEVARQPEGEVAPTSKKVPNQANQIQTQITIEQGRPVVCSQRASQPRFSRDSTNFNVGRRNNSR